MLEHPSPLKLSPSSQDSSPKITPSPHKMSQVEIPKGGFVQVHPVSTRQLTEHPSRSAGGPLSHSSLGGSTIELPQILQVVGELAHVHPGSN